MNISVLQPVIERANIRKNAAAVQKLIDNAAGDLLVLAEYALTGSLVLDRHADIRQWAADSEAAIQGLSVPQGKRLLINSLIVREGKIYNACTLLPGNEILRVKNYPDQTETDAGISAGNGIPVTELDGKKLIVVICADFRKIRTIPTDGADMILLIYHFTAENYQNRLADCIGVSKERGIPVIAASLASDKNCGRSCYVSGSTAVSLGNGEGILEIAI